MKIEVNMINAPTLKTRDVAKMLDLDIETIRRLARRNEIRSYRIGKGFRFFPEDIQRYIETTKELEKDTI